MCNVVETCFSHLSYSHAPHSPSHSLHLPRIPAPIRNHQPIPQRNRLPGLELIHLVEHDGEAGAGVRRLAYEQYVGIALIVWSIVCELCSLCPGDAPAWAGWHLLQDRIVSRNHFPEALGNSLPVEHVYLNRQVGFLERFL